MGLIYKKAWLQTHTLVISSPPYRDNPLQRQPVGGGEYWCFLVEPALTPPGRVKWVEMVCLGVFSLPRSKQAKQIWWLCVVARRVEAGNCFPSCCYWCCSNMHMWIHKHTSVDALHIKLTVIHLYCSAGKKKRFVQTARTRRRCTRRDTYTHTCYWLGVVQLSSSRPLWAQERQLKRQGGGGR